MSIQEIFFNYIEKELDVDPTQIISYRTGSNNRVILFLRGDEKIVLRDPKIFFLARESKKEQYLGSDLIKEKLLRRLYFIRVAYKGLSIPFNEFRKNYLDKRPGGVLKEIIRDEESIGRIRLIRDIALQLFSKIFPNLTTYNSDFLERLEEALESQSGERLVKIISDIFRLPYVPIQIETTERPTEPVINVEPYEITIQL